PRCTGSGTNCDAFVIGRYTAGTPTYYRVGVVQGTGRADVYLRAQRNDGSNLASDIDTGIPAGTTATVWVRVEFQGVSPTTVRARAWSAGAPEPGTWLLTTTDSTAAEQVAGQFGVRARNEDTGTAHAFGFQSYVVTALASGPVNGNGGSDTFQRTVASGWGKADSGGWWTVVGSPWAWSVAPGAGNVAVAGGAAERGYLSQFTVQDVDVVQTVVLPRCSAGGAECDAFVLGRYAPAYSPTYYEVGVVQGAGPDILLRARRSDGTVLMSDIDTGIPASAGAKVMLRVDFTGINPTTVHARAWLAGTTEPAAWQVSTSDSNGAQQSPGMVGVQFQDEDPSTAHSFALQGFVATGASTLATPTPNPTTTAHLMYVVIDGEVYVYDIDHSQTLVKQFAIPEEGKRGVAFAPTRGYLYVCECGPGDCAGTEGSLIAYDVVHDVVAWVANYPFGVDQFAVTPNGATIYMPHGEDASDGMHSVLDASDGKPIGTITTGTNGHNTVVSLDGTKAYLGGLTGTNDNYLHVISTATNTDVLDAGPTVNGVRPFTINGKATLAFTNSTNWCGFQVLSLSTGAVLYTVPFSGTCAPWAVSNGPSHGVSLSPDETRLYVMDGPLAQVEVYDVSGLPASAPVFVGSVNLPATSGDWEASCQTYCEREGWVLNDLSGRYVYVGDWGTVIDTSTLKVVTTLAQLQNTRLLLEIDWAGGAPTATSTRFGIGRVTS
ncbi:MAG TPA: hypothetical protein VMU14_09020, partial [Acidimicrobiales bacterium]|nr:hypothetical protein [Acidimicrobiales bacterium]